MHRSAVERSLEMMHRPFLLGRARANRDTCPVKYGSRMIVYYSALAAAAVADIVTARPLPFPRAIKVREAVKMAVETRFSVLSFILYFSTRIAHAGGTFYEAEGSNLFDD